MALLTFGPPMDQETVDQADLRAPRARRESGLDMLRAARDASRTRTTSREVSAAEPEGDGLFREPLLKIWRRRVVTIPALFIATGLYFVLSPLLFAYALVADLRKRRPLLLCRFHLTVLAVLFWHCFGVFLLTAWWVVGKAARFDQASWRRWHAGLESWWSHRVIGIARRLYGVKVEIDGAELCEPGPALILMRHASLVDTMLPTGYLGWLTGMQMRIVKKRELLWDPAVDLVVHRVPRALVRRGSADAERELEQLARVTDGMGEEDAVLIFPEGTRFTSAKQAEVMAKLRARDPAAAARWDGLRHVLPIRPAGTNALLDRRPDMDVVFCAHTGLEGASKLDDFLDGSLLCRTWKVKVWRVPRREVPDDPDKRLAWLASWWRKVDDWIDENRVYGASHRRWAVERYGARRRRDRGRRAA